MARKKAKQEKEDKDSKTEKSLSDILESVLNKPKYKGDHFGFDKGDEVKKQDIISTGSFLFDYVIGGGFRSGSWSRFYSEPECGKTSMSLCWGKQWQDFYGEEGEVVYFNAEGRVHRNLIDRSGIDKRRLQVVNTNVSDLIYEAIETMSHNANGKKIFFILDSTDACIRKHDKEKEYSDSEKIGGGATILSSAGKRLSLLFNHSDHHFFIASQVRDKMSTGGMGGGKAPSGGNAPKFYASLAGHIKNPWSDTFIYEDPSDKKSKIIGRKVEILLKKTYNESTDTLVAYPVKYGHIGGVWKAYEAMIVCDLWGLTDKKSSWYNFTEEFLEVLNGYGVTLDSTSFQGEKNLRAFFDSNPELVDATFKYVSKFIVQPPSDDKTQ